MPPLIVPAIGFLRYLLIDIQNFRKGTNKKAKAQRFCPLRPN